MESTERIAQSPQLERDGSDGHIVTMRDFLEKPRVARDFQDLKADAQRLESVGRDCDALKAGAAEAELEAGKLARMHEQHRQHRLGFRIGVILAAFFVALDALPVNLAAHPSRGFVIGHVDPPRGAIRMMSDIQIVKTKPASLTFGIPHAPQAKDFYRGDRRGR